MHQIHFLLGLRPTPRWGSLQCPPTPASKGPTSMGMEGNGKGEEKVKEKEGKRWRERFGPPKKFGVAPPMTESRPTRSLATAQKQRVNLSTLAVISRI